MNVRPIRNLIAVRGLGEPSKSLGGILLPEAQKTRSKLARVVATGPGQLTSRGVRLTPVVDPGFVVLIDPFKLVWTEGSGMVGTPVLEKDRLGLIPESAILAVIDLEGEELTDETLESLILSIRA